MGLDKDILHNLTEGSRTYEELKETFPRSNLAQILIDMEERNLIENRDGTWFITRKGQKKTAGKKQMAQYVLLVPAIIFFLLSAQYYSGYTDAITANEQLLQEKAAAEAELARALEQKEAAEAEYTAKTALLTQEQGKTSQLRLSQEEASSAVDAVRQEVNYFECLERCAPDKFVTVDNSYVKAKVDELTQGLTTLREKQEAIYEFVRDEIDDDEYIFHTGRLDLWEYPEDILKRGSGHYEDKFLLLLTMLRIAGTPPEDVRFVAAEVDGNDSWIWVECYDGSTWWVLDPFEGYTFTDNPKDEFYSAYRVIILWWFNDKGYRGG